MIIFFSRAVQKDSKIEIAIDILQKNIFAICN